MSKRRYPPTGKQRIVLIIGKTAAYLVVVFSLYLLLVLGQLKIFLPLYPWLSGFPFWSRTYVILLQNEAELRPGGGFISGVATLRFTAGVPTGLSIVDVYSLENSVSSYHSAMEGSPLGNRDGAFQDANYDSDFPTNAERIIGLYTLAHPNVSVDGVVAINFSVLEDLVRVVGTLELAGKDVMADSFFPRLEHEVHAIDRHNVQQLQERKDVLRPLLSQLVRKVLFSPWKYPSFFGTVEGALVRKDIQIFFIPDILQNSMSKRGWAGVLPTPSHSDILSVVEANQGGMKSDRFIERSVQYTVDLGYVADGTLISPTATVRIRLNHYGEYNEPLSFTYRGSVRVLAPPGSRLLHSKPGDFSTTEKGYESFGRAVILEPGESTTIEFSYALPPTIFADGEYSLHIQKQPGTHDYYSVNVIVPGDAVLSGPGWQGGVRVASRRAFLDHDEQLSLSVIPDSIPPRMVKQVFRDIQTIELHTNEPLNEPDCEALDNFALIDMGRTHPETTDMPKILAVDCEERAITLKLAGINRQPEEFYRLTVRSLEDVAGNRLENRTYTIVQRLSTVD